MLRTETAASGALLIFDEVMTSRLGRGGLQSLVGVTPDLTTLGKYLGGGLSFGAFGGRADLMAAYDPTRPGALFHAGTFNNNVLTMSAGIAGLEHVLDDATLTAVNDRGDRLRAALDAVARPAGLHVSGRGSLMTIHPAPYPIIASAPLTETQAPRRSWCSSRWSTAASGWPGAAWSPSASPSPTPCATTSSLPSPRSRPQSTDRAVAHVVKRRPGGRPDLSRRAVPSATRAGSPERHTGHDRRLEGSGRQSPDRPVLRIPPQRGDLVAIRLDLKFLPACFKWAGLAALASHHVRLALFPFRLDTDRTGYVDIPHSLGRQKLLLMQDVNKIRATNNAIFDDIFWVHLAYATADDGVERLRALLGAERHYAPVLSGFETIDQGRRVLEDSTAAPEARRTAVDSIWQGNLALLEHEQRALVQPNFDGLSCAFARLVSMGSVTSFEVRGVRHELDYFTSFYVFSFTRRGSQVLRARAWPRMTRYDDRWRWIVGSVIPRFRRFEADTSCIEATLRRIFAEARDYASNPCVLPRRRN